MSEQTVSHSTMLLIIRIQLCSLGALGGFPLEIKTRIRYPKFYLIKLR